MHLNKINGNTYYINAPTNIGVYLFKNKYTMLIDTGNNNQQARKLEELIAAENMAIKYIVNTHNHVDHTGGNIYFKEHFAGSLIYTSEVEKLFIENDYLFPMYLYGGSPIRELSRHFLKAKSTTVDYILNTGINKINDEKFEIIALPGHSAGQIGVGTKDKVCFLGDSLFSRDIIEKYSFPFLFDIQEEINTCKVIETLDYEYFVLSHGSKVYNSKDIRELVQYNRDNIDKYLNLALELLIQPKTREELFEEIAILEELDVDFKEYYFSLSTTGAIIAYLYAAEKLNYQLENGKLYYYRK